MLMASIPSRRKGTVAKLATSTTSNIIRIIEGLVLVPLYIKCIGQETYGAWLATGSIITYLSLSDFGLNSVIIQKVGNAFGAKDTERTISYIVNGVCVAIFLSLLPAIISLILCNQLDRFIPIGPENEHLVSQAFVIAGIATSLCLLMYNIGGITTALQLQVETGLAIVASSILGLAMTVCLLLAGYNVLSLPLGTLAFASGSLLSMVMILIRYLRNDNLLLLLKKIDAKIILEMIKSSGMIFIATGGVKIAQQSDNLIIGMVLGARAVLMYSLTKRVFDLFNIVVGHFTGAFTPALAHFFGEMKDSILSTRKITGTLIYVTMIFTMIAMMSYVTFNMSFMSLWLGPGFYAGTKVTCAIGIYGIFSLLSIVLFNIAFTLGEFRLASVATGSEAILRLLLILIFIKLLGLFGVGIAAIASVSTSSIWILWIFYQKKFKITRHMILRNSVSLAKIGIGILGIGIIMRMLPLSMSLFNFTGLCALFLVLASSWVLLVDVRSRTLFIDLIKGRLIS
jgi:O-antigen/teichoic acid export membrane protein